MIRIDTDECDVLRTMHTGLVHALGGEVTIRLADFVNTPEGHEVIVKKSMDGELMTFRLVPSAMARRIEEEYQ